MGGAFSPLTEVMELLMPFVVRPKTLAMFADRLTQEGMDAPRSRLARVSVKWLQLRRRTW